MKASQLTQLIKDQAQALGFNSVGCCPALPAPGFERFQEWLRAGFGGEMHYLANREKAYRHPESVLAGVRSLVVMTMNYRTHDAQPPQEGEGRIARYAWGPRDYHDVIHERLAKLAAAVRGWVPEARVRGVVDTAPLLEREFAQLAGLGWIGKNTLLLSPHSGSYFFLSVLLTDQVLDYDEPFASDHCGTCRACLDACPTQAFPRAYVLDATRCISYLTIELRSAIPASNREPLADWLFGCDICQEVCPWNSKAPLSNEPAFVPRDDQNPVDLAALFELSDDSFRQRFRATPLWRAKRRGLLRNAACLLAARPTPRAVVALSRGLNDAEPLVRATCAWALGRCGDEKARILLEQRHTVETDAEVQAELKAAFDELAKRKSI